MSPYPTAACQTEEIFGSRHNPSIYNTHLADNIEVTVPIDVTVPGQDFHLGHRYNSPQAYHDEIYPRIAPTLKPGTWRVEVVRVIGGGESAWAAVELLSTATSIW